MRCAPRLRMAIKFVPLCKLDGLARVLFRLLGGLQLRKELAWDVDYDASIHGEPSRKLLDALDLERRLLSGWWHVPDARAPTVDAAARFSHRIFLKCDGYGKGVAWL